MSGLTYAKVGGPPAHWQKLEVIDNTSGKLIRDVLEVNTMEGWLTRHIRDGDDNLVLDGGQLAKETISGRFRIVERR